MIYNNNDTNGYSPPEEQNNKVGDSGCTTCRQKIAQQTFDMVSGGSVYNPVVTNINTVNEVPTFAVGFGLTVPTHPSEYEINAIDMLYGSRISTQQQPPNTIDSLYRKGEEVQSYLRDPCWQNKNSKTYKYPDSFDLSRYIFSDNLIKKGCSFDISFFIHSKLHSMGQKVTIPISLKDCCESFKKNLFCAVNDFLLGQAYDDFKNCVQMQIENTVNQFMINNPNILQPISFPQDYSYEDPWTAIIRQTDTIGKYIEISKGMFLKFDDSTKSSYTGYNSKNNTSCLCGGSEPIYCCNPESDKEKCYCPDGSLKDLCKDCNGNYPSIVFPLPLVLNDKGCEVRTDTFELANQSTIESTVYFPDGRVESFDPVNISSILLSKSQTKEYQRYYRLELKIPNPNIDPPSMSVRIEIVIHCPCGICCDQSLSKEKAIFKLNNYFTIVVTPGADIWYNLEGHDKYIFELINCIKC